MGLGIGLLSAVAMSASSSLADLALGGVESVRVAFRFGIHMYRVSQLLEPRGTLGSPSSWTCAVTGVSAEDVQRELDEFNYDTVCSHLSLFLPTRALRSES